MTKAEIREGLFAGKRLTQEEWSTADEIKAVDELVAEGVAHATDWQYCDNSNVRFGSVRFVTGKDSRHEG